MFYEATPSVVVQLDKKETSSLISDPIPCFLDYIEVMFSFWATENVNLKLCYVETTTGFKIECSRLYNSTATDYPGFFQYKKHKGIKQPFMVYFH